MFFLLQQYEVTRFAAGHLQNPLAAEQAMVLVFLRTKMHLAVCTVNSKKEAGEFRDLPTGAVIPRRLWTAEMKVFYQEKSSEVPRPPFVFKMTILGWMASLLVVAVLCMIVYDGVKPPLAKRSETIAMEQKPAVGDIFFGHFEAPQGADDRLGFGWFKVLKVEGDTYYIAKSKIMSKISKPKEQLDNSAFESEGVPVKITEQAGYLINLKSADQGLEIYFTDKK
ncbi:hypothetical protein AAW12_24285 [Sphingobacterium sp. Ag1]|uniref:hypothetical protein n=1 Tax=Sphingobacterium sp. Ag1 TaxID=1643451 RepID=UPI000627680D|nr:hypothetical protein [Sphingobacterium sp. Ag1]KKO89232.1 hypothetical protein AAW12_24285 [Sphingobacterium sp. Ag1]